MDKSSLSSRCDTSTFVHYCFAYDLKDWLKEVYSSWKALTMSHQSTWKPFIDFLKEYISFVSNRSSGACGLPNLVPYMYYFWKKDVEQGYYIGSPGYHARQHIQRFIYAVNQPYVRDGIQSAFTNVSVFDMPYLRGSLWWSRVPRWFVYGRRARRNYGSSKKYLWKLRQSDTTICSPYPVLSISLLRQNGKFQDEGFCYLGG